MAPRVICGQGKIIEVQPRERRIVLILDGDPSKEFRYDLVHVWGYERTGGAEDRQEWTAFHGPRQGKKFVDAANRLMAHYG